MDLAALKTYLSERGDPLVIAASDTNLPQEFRDFLNTMPNREVTLHPGSDGIRLEGSTLSISGASTDRWRVDGMGAIEVTLVQVAFTINDGSKTPVFDCTAKGTLPFSASVHPPVSVTALHQDANPWQIQLAKQSSGVTPTELMLLGKSGKLPFDIPPNLEVLSQVLKVDPDQFQITFYPNTTFDAYYTFQLSAPSAKWEVVPGIIEFAGLDIRAVVTSNGLSAIVTGHLSIDQVGVDLGVGLNSGDDWTAFVRPSKGSTFPGLMALASWMAGSAKLPADTAKGFSNLKFDPHAFDLALAGVAVGFNWRTRAINFLEIKSLLTIGGMPLDLVLRLPTITFAGSLHDGKPVKVKDMLAAFQLSPEGIPDNLTVSAVNLLADAAGGLYSIGITVDEVWHRGPLDLEEVRVAIAYSMFSGLSGTIFCKFKLGASAELYLSTEYAEGWLFSGGTIPGSSIEIGAVIADFSSKFRVDLPKVLHSFSLKQFGFEFNTATNVMSGQFTVELTVNNHPVELSIEAVLSSDDNKTAVTVNLTLLIGTAEFHGTLTDQANTTFSLAWSDAQNPLEFEQIAKALGFHDVPAIPPALNLGLIGASLTYDFTTKVLILTAESQTYGDAVFIADGSNSQKPLYAFGIAVPLHVSFASIPVVGSKFPDVKDYGIVAAGVWVLSREIDKDEIQKLNGYIAAAQATVPQGQTLPVLPEGEDLTWHVLLSATLELGPAVTYPLQVHLGSTGNAAQIAAPQMSSDGNVTPPNTSPDGATWKDIQKTVGPITVQRLGLKYAESQLYLLVDLGFSAGGLTIDLAGLGISSGLTRFVPEFHLAGLEIAYKESSFEIAGELLNMPVQPPTEFEYAGSATLKAGNFDLTALGSYARVSGQTSLFIFALLESPLGGPPFFFVTGVAAGFGFNRNLLLPSVDEVPNFPLVAAAMNPSKVFPSGSNQSNSLSQALGVMEKYIPPSPGEYWLAAGIRFTSFEMLSSFALVSVAFGNQLEVALLGQSQLSLPADPSGENPENDKIANVELALEVTIAPQAGDFKAQAALTSNSWILDKNCRLTGGFAFYIWYGVEHSGDFVITLGGFNPHYQPAKWYPNEPRLGFNWPVSDSLTIHGGCYFALTPHAVMAGGNLQVLFQMGGWLKAWLTAYIDFLIEWQPFFYEAQAGVAVGVSVTLSIFGVQTTLTLELGATVYLSGPPFGGSATIHYWIISFTIPFGDQTKTAPPALSFDQFNQALLPKQPGQMSLLQGDGPKKRPIFITPVVASGVIDSPASNPNLTMPVVAAGALEIQVTSNWPATELHQDSDSIYKYSGELYARAMHGIHPLSGTLTVQVMYQGQDRTSWFALSPILKNAPTALWSKWEPGGPAINPPTDKNGDPIVTVPDVPFGIRVRSGKEQDCDPSAPIPLKNLASEPLSICISWPDFPLPNQAKRNNGIEAIAQTIVAPGIAATREKILQSLKSDNQGRDLPQSVVIGPGLSQRPGDIFLASPEVANLGELPKGNQ